MADDAALDALLEQLGDEADQVPTDSSGDEAPAPSGRETSQMRALRKWGKAQEKRASAAQQKVDELTALITERDEREKDALLKSSGLTDAQAEIFKKAGYPIEGLDAFKSALGVQAEPPLPTFSPTPSGGEAPNVNQRLSKSEFETMASNDFALAQQYAERGLVDWNRR